MEDYGLTQKRSENYMPDLNKLIQRCERFEESNESSVEYQIVLADIREQIKELDLDVRKTWWAQRPVLAWYLVCLSIVIAIIWPTCLLEYLRRI